MPRGAGRREPGGQPMTETPEPTEFGRLVDGGYTLIVSGGGPDDPVQVHAQGSRLWPVCTINRAALQDPQIEWRGTWWYDGLEYIRRRVESAVIDMARRHWRRQRAQRAALNRARLAGARRRMVTP